MGSLFGLSGLSRHACVSQLWRVMGIWFEVEKRVRRGGRAYVIARIEEPRPFSLCGQHTLGGHPIEPWIGRPSSSGKGGDPDLFSFALRDMSALEDFEEGSRILLAPAGASCVSGGCDD